MKRWYALYVSVYSYVSILLSTILLSSIAWTTYMADINTRCPPPPPPPPGPYNLCKNAKSSHYKANHSPKNGYSRLNHSDGKASISDLHISKPVLMILYKMCNYEPEPFIHKLKQGFMHAIGSYYILHPFIYRNQTWRINALGIEVKSTLL